MKSLLRCLLSLLATIAATAQVPEFTKVSVFPIGSTTFVSGTYGVGKFVAVTTNAIAYSQDGGTTWLPAKNYPFIQYRAVLFGGGRFVAVGVGQQTAISEDGRTWSSVTLPASQNFSSLAYGNNTFAVAGDARGFSTDGRSWSFTVGNDADVVFGNGKFLFSRDVTGLPTSISNYFTWVGGWFGGFRQLAVRTNMFVCIGVYRTKPPNSYTSDSLFYSTDGALWSGGTVDLGSKYTLYQVQDGYVETGYKFYLPDGGTSEFPPNQTCGAFAWDKTNVLAFCTTTNYMYSPNRSWLQISSPPEIRIAAAAANGRLFIGVGATNSNGTMVPNILIATNGLPAMISIPAPSGSGLLTSVRYADGKFVATGKGGTIIRSGDGTSWTRRLSNTMSDLDDLAFGNGIWVAVGDAGKITTSSDTSVFSLRSSGTEVAIFGVIYGTNQFVAVGKDGLIVTSRNGLDWSATGTDEARDLYSIAYGNNRYVAVGTNGIVHVSTNAVQWQTTTIPNVTAFRRVAFGNGSFVALTSTNNFLYASKDGLNWTSTQISDVNLYGLDFSDDELWLTGEKSAIYKTSLSPALAPTVHGELNAQKQFVLTLQPATPANYQIESTSSLSTPTWEPLTTLINIQSATDWTDTNSPLTTKFYRVLRQ
jgi:hypothetical protein